MMVNVIDPRQVVLGEGVDTNNKLIQLDHLRWKKIKASDECYRSSPRRSRWSVDIKNKQLMQIDLLVEEG
jgi:hypothetical protein